MRVIHTHRNASADLDGLVWEPVKGGYLSPELSDAAAARYLSIPPAGLFVVSSEPEKAPTEDSASLAEMEATIATAEKAAAKEEAETAAKARTAASEAETTAVISPPTTKKKPRH